MEAGEAASHLASKSAAPCGSQLGRLSWRPVLATWFGVGGRRWRSTKCGVRNGEVTADHSSSYFTPWDEHYGGGERGNQMQHEKDYDPVDA
ncbi:hypothetical protein B296_00015880 [Ensete ventricosum]|uniref:Uncharacterized protein n=1 Tax=Ensete ventricosum TaxID=4639 RepID=A0A426YKR3_ENSVE|nr:hypothetical protein B296_00015880 [Ensete ventricosum]